MRPFFLGTSILLGVGLLAHGATYHLSPSGDDSRTAEQAGRSSTPWKSLAKISALSLAPGDSVLLERGGVWRESLRVRGGGDPSRPVVVAPWGTGAPPAILGTDSVVGTAVGDRFEALAPAGVKRVLVGSSVMAVGRYPDTGWVTATAVEGDSVVVVPSLAGTDWTGAKVHLRTKQWTLETHLVLSGTGGRLAVDRRLIYPLPLGGSLFLSTHPSVDDASGWTQDPVTGILSWPSSWGKVVEASVRGPLLDLAKGSGVLVKGLRLSGAAGNAVMAGTGTTLDDCSIEAPSGYGVMLGSGRDLVVRNCSIRDVGNGAVVAWGNATRIEGNTIRSGALLSTWGPDGMGSGCCGGRALELTGDSLVVKDNDIDSTGYIGIGFRGARSRIERNRVAHHCMTTEDCAGIYTWSGSFDAAISAQGSIVRGNLVLDAVGAPSGWAKPWEQAMGIYLDDATEGVLVDSNVVTRCDAGIYLHNTRDILVAGNLLYDNHDTQIRLQRDTILKVGEMTRNRIEGNTMVLVGGGSAEVQEFKSTAQQALLATLEGNVACRSDAQGAGCRRDGAVLWNRERFSIDDPRLGQDVLADGTFESGIGSWSSWPAQVSRAAVADPSGGGSVLRISVSPGTLAGTPLLSSSSFSVKSGDWWFLSYRVRGTLGGQVVHPILRRAGGDWEPVGLSITTVLDTVWTEHRHLFQSNDTATARLDFGFAANDSAWMIDDIRIRPVPGSLLEGGDGATLLLNASRNPSSVPLPSGSWGTIEGIAAPSAMMLPGYGGVALFEGSGFPVGVVSSPARPAGPSLHRRPGGWVVEGLSRRAAVIDANGRRIGFLEPDAQGRAFLPGSPLGGGIRWIAVPGATPLRVF